MVGIILGSVFGVLFLVVLALVLTIMYKLFWVSKWKELDSYEDKDFVVKSCNGIKYLLDRGIPYKGDFKTTNRREYLESFDFSSSNECTPFGLKGEIEKIIIPDCYNKLDSKYRDYVGDVWYQTTININKQNDEKIRLNFEGCYLSTKVYVDGVFLGENNEGYLPFTFDISHLSNGEHKLVLKVNNQCRKNTIPISLFEGHKLGWYHYSGLHNSVYIEYQPVVSLLKCAAIPKQISKDEWVLSTSVLFENFDYNKSFDIKLRVKDKDGVLSEVCETIECNDKVCGKTIDIKCKNPKLWSEFNPNLYQVEVVSPFETSEVTTGFRKITWHDGKIFINDKQTFLKGVCRHEDSGAMGLATVPSTIKDELERIQKINGNFVRCAHYPHSKITFEMMDEMGLMSWDEVPFYQAGQYITHAVFGKGLGAVAFKASALKNLIKGIDETALARNHELVKLTCQSIIKLIERDINHPSIITWSVGNENWSVNKACGKVLAYIKGVVKSFDDSRACNYASICMPIMAQRYESSFKVMDWACVNEYYGWYYMKIKNVGSLAKAVAKKYPDKPFVITETGSDTLYGLRDTATYPPTNRCSEDYQCYFLKEQDRVISKYAPNFAGFCVWVFKDFPCPEYNEKNQVPFYNMKGLFDKDMNEKMSYKALGEVFEKHDKQINKEGK